MSVVAPVPDGSVRLARALLLALAAWHLVFWVAAPALTYAMLPADTLELLGWGQEWQLGYYKHPPLGAWLGEAWLQLWGGWPDSLYLLSQLCVLATLAYVWRTALLVTDPARAALAAVVLAGSYFHTLLAPNFNMNVLQLPLWAGFCHHLLRALRGDARHWLLAGAFGASLLLAKYSGLLLLASAALVVVLDPRGRAALRGPWLWSGAALGLVLLAPHLAWLAEHWQLPLAYLRGFDSSGGDWHWHLLEPLRFAAGALAGMLLTGVLLAALLARGPRPRRSPDTLALLVLALGPLLLSVGYGLVSGSRLKTTWAVPFFNYAGLLALLLLPTRVDLVRLRRFAVLLVAVVLLTAGGHLAYKLGSTRSKTAFDGPALAAQAAGAWARRFDTPLRIVAADHVLSAIVSGYAPDRPSMLVAGDFTRSPWLAPEDLERDGAIVLCEAGDAPCLPMLPSGTGEQALEVDGRRFVLRLLPPTL